MYSSGSSSGLPSCSGGVKDGNEKSPKTELVSFGCQLSWLPHFRELWSAMNIVELFGDDSFQPLSKTIPVSFNGNAGVRLNLDVHLRLTLKRRTQQSVNGKICKVIVVNVNIVGNDWGDKTLTFVSGEVRGGREKYVIETLKDRSGYYEIEFKDFRWPRLFSNPRIRISARVEIESQDPKLGDHTSFLLSDTLSDITIKCGHYAFPAHRFLLAAASPIFMKMLTIKMKENKERVIEMKDVSPDVGKAILRFIYTGSLEIKPDVAGPAQRRLAFAQELYENAAMYELAGLKVICAKEIASIINLNNVVKVYAWALLHEVKNLQAVIFKFVEDNKKAFLDRHPLREVINVCPEIIDRLLRKELESAKSNSYHFSFF